MIAVPPANRDDTASDDTANDSIHTHSLSLCRSMPAAQLQKASCHMSLQLHGWMDAWTLKSNHLCRSLVMRDSHLHNVAPTALQNCGLISGAFRVLPTWARRLSRPVLCLIDHGRQLGLEAFLHLVGESGPAWPASSVSRSAVQSLATKVGCATWWRRCFSLCTYQIHSCSACMRLGGKPSCDDMSSRR
ncbi:hypothetical protein BC567DRAFT_235535 [Phyllosticta citribraziliensis]